MERSLMLNLKKLINDLKHSCESSFVTFVVIWSTLLKNKMANQHCTKIVHIESD